MYTPLRFMDQIENMIVVSNARRMEGLINRLSLNLCNQWLTKDRKQSLQDWAIGWSDYTDGIVDEDMFQYYAKKYEKIVGIEVPSAEDLYGQMLVSTVHNEWSRSKRVYRIEEQMCKDFCSMSVPENVKTEVILRMPSKCFYVEPDMDLDIIGNAHGFFVTSEVYDDHVLLCLTVLYQGKRVMFTHTILTVPTEEEKFNNGDDTFREWYDLTLEDGSTVRFNERLFVKFILNFLIYFNAVNNDIEYTERTRSIYKPIGEGRAPKNKMSEVEEFGVGYSFATPVSASRTRVKYVNPDGENVKTPPTNAKRGYSSNYRSAHWHHYWINDPDNTGEKKLIVKWIGETFVRGNKENDKVTIHRVTK